MERRHRDHRREADSAERLEAAGAQEQILSLYSAIGNAAFSRLVAPESRRAVLRVAKGGKKSRERPSQAPAAPAGEPLLRQGSRGPSVAALQADLVVCGFEIAVDGIFGPQTDGAVRGFQAEEGLDPDGIVGPLTRAALLRRGGGSLPPVAATPTAGSLPGLEAAPPGKGGKKQTVF